MIEYIYIVKVPNCTDECFEFFEDAKSFALSVLGKNPCITQTEVCRNSFGECTDSHDLGTIWSWEDVMKDVESEDTVFSKAETFGISNNELDDDLLESAESIIWQCEIDGIAVGTVVAKTEEEAYAKMEKKYPEYTHSSYDGVSLVYPVEEFEYDDRDITFETDCVVNDRVLAESFDRKAIETAVIDAAAARNLTIDNIKFEETDEAVKVQVAFEDHARSVELGFTEFKHALFTKKIIQSSDVVERFGSIIRFTVPTDSSAELVSETAKSLATDKTIKALVEELEENEDTVECKWCEELFDKADCRYEVNLGYLCPQCEAAIKSRGETLTFREDAQPVDKDALNETYDPKEEVEFYYKELTIDVVGKQYDADRWDEKEYTSDYTFKVNADDVACALWDTFMTDEDVTDVEGGFNTLEDDAAWKDFLNTHFDALVAKYYDELLEYFEEDALEQFRENTSWEDTLPEPPEHDDFYDRYLEDVSTEANKEEVTEFVQYSEDKPLLAESDDEIQEVSDLMTCPECGKNTFDTETGICINCGLNVCQKSSFLSEELEEKDLADITKVVATAVSQLKNKLEQEVDSLADQAFKHQENIIKAVEREADYTVNSINGGKAAQ